LALLAHENVKMSIMNGMSQTVRNDIINDFRDRIRAGKRLRLSKAELEAFIEGFLALLHEVNTEIEIQSLCNAEIKLLEEGYPQASVAKYLTVYRKAIAAAIEDGSLKLTATNSHRYIYQQRITGIHEERFEHWALTYLKYSSEVYESIDQRSQLTNRDKQLNLRLVPVESYLGLLRGFLGKRGMYEARWLATAIAGLTGRRFAEVMAKGTFSLTEHPYLLRFEGQLKTRAARIEGYDIVTLFPANEVLDAINRLRQLPEVKAIARLKGKALSEELNRFNQKLNNICSSALMQVVPPMEGKKTVSVHNLRSLYGAIAVYFFCPPLQHEYVFVQHFLGHVMDSPATGHYFRFALGDENGTLIREKGVLLAKVNQLPLGNPLESQLLELEDEAAPSVEPKTRVKDAKIEMNQATQETVEADSIKAGSNTINPNDLQSLRAEWFSALERLRAEFESQLQAVRKESDAGWFVRRVEELERENLALRLERDRAISQIEGSQDPMDALNQLQAENVELAQKLKLAQDTLDRFRALLNGGEPTDEIENTPESSAAQTFASAPLTQDVPLHEINAWTTSLKNAQPEKPQALLADPQAISPTGTKPLAKTRGPKSGKAFQRAEAIVLGIKDWNRLYPAESFAINAGVLETVFRVHRQAVKEFFDAYQNELWDYHQEIGVESPRWHNRGKDTQKLKAFVTERMQG
jgi:Telomere resolvase